MPLSSTARNSWLAGLALLTSACTAGSGGAAGTTAPSASPSPSPSAAETPEIAATAENCVYPARGPMTADEKLIADALLATTTAAERVAAAAQARTMAVAAADADVAIPPEPWFMASDVRAVARSARAGLLEDYRCAGETPGAPDFEAVTRYGQQAVEYAAGGIFFAEQFEILNDTETVQRVLSGEAERNISSATSLADLQERAAADLTAAADMAAAVGVVGYWQLPYGDVERNACVAAELSIDDVCDLELLVDEEHEGPDTYEELEPHEHPELHEPLESMQPVAGESQPQHALGTGAPLRVTDWRPAAGSSAATAPPAAFRRAGGGVVGLAGRARVPA